MTAIYKFNTDNNEYNIETTHKKIKKRGSPQP